MLRLLRKYRNIYFKDYKISVNKCKNNHYKNNISFFEYKNIQKEITSKIICSKCLNKIDMNKLKVYKCLTCNIILCELWKIQHDKKHNIFDYKIKNFIWDKHSIPFIKYYNDCKYDICASCENDHKSRDLIEFRDILIDKNILKE